MCLQCPAHLPPSRHMQGGAAPLSKAGNQMWALPLSALTAGLRNMGLSQFRTKELLLLENELQVSSERGRWRSLPFYFGTALLLVF